MPRPTISAARSTTATPRYAIVSRRVAKRGSRNENDDRRRLRRLAARESGARLTRVSPQARWLRQDHARGVGRTRPREGGGAGKPRGAGLSTGTGGGNSPGPCGALHLRPRWRRQPTAKARQLRRPDLALRATSQSLAGLRGRVVG